MLKHVRRAVAGLAVAALAAAVPLSASAHEFTCEPRTPGYWCGGASVLLGEKDDTAFCAAFAPFFDPGALPATGCGEQVCGLLGFGSCEDLCGFFGSANAGETGSMADVLEKFFVALQLGSPEILPYGGINCVDESGTPACGDGFPDCSVQEIQDLIDCGDACRDEQEVVKNCIDLALNADPYAPTCVSAL